MGDCSLVYQAIHQLGFITYLLIFGRFPYLAILEVDFIAMTCIPIMFSYPKKSFGCVALVGSVVDHGIFFAFMVYPFSYHDTFSWL